MSTPARLLLRDLAQLATPAGSGAPLRGAALGTVDVLEDAYVLCRGDTIEIAVNGVHRNRIEKLSSTSGGIGLQLEGTPVEFRNIWLEPL